MPPCLSLPTQLLKYEETVYRAVLPYYFYFSFPLFTFLLFGFAYGHQDVVTKHWLNFNLCLFYFVRLVILGW